MTKKTDLAVNRRKKATSGAATAYMSRNQALKKLQLHLNDFRRICILKGIYPHEPRHRKKAAGSTGSTAPKTYYYAKDIQFLLHEPIVIKFREYKVFSRKLRRALGKGEYAAADHIRENKPKYTLDHIVRERYPTFVDAVRDLSDCLSLCFMFATLPSSHRTKGIQVALCRRLTIEFMLYVISSKSLRKVFVSIKGVYYEAEICDQRVNWVVPHPRAYERPVDVDFRIMSTFVEFYTTLLGFVNFRLFASLGVHYPPELTLNAEDSFHHDAAASLALCLKAPVASDEADIADEFPAGDDVQVEKQKAEQAQIKALQSLFSGFRFFLQRETPRESLAFVIRSCGGEVSWDRTAGGGCSYQEDDERITHQIVDRGHQSSSSSVIVVSRCYIQPQWVFDCVNARQLLPVDRYFPGVTLPPHLSPFVEEKEGEYVPPEKRRLLGQEVEEMELQEVKSEPESIEDSEEVEDGSSSSDDDDDDDDDDNDTSSDKSTSDEDSGSNENSNTGVSKRQLKKQQNQKIRETQATSSKPVTSVTTGSVERVNVSHVRQQTEREERKLAEMMIPKKKQRLYHKIMYSKKKTAHEAKVLAAKREEHDRKLKKKQAKQMK